MYAESAICLVSLQASKRLKTDSMCSKAQPPKYNTQEHTLLPPDKAHEAHTPSSQVHNISPLALPPAG